MLGLRDNSPPLFFLHIPKTAGISLRTWLGGHFAAPRVFCIDHRDPEGGVRGPLDDYDLVAGHACYRFVDRFGRPPRVVTFLRDPIERALSAFYFFRRLGPDGLAREGAEKGVIRACELSLADFITRQPREAATHLGCTQTWMLARERLAYFTDGPTTVTSADLEVARATLALCDFVGLTERMDESADLLRRGLGWPPGERVGRENPTPGRPGYADLDPRTRRLLEGLTAPDRELYRFARQLFQERLATTEGRFSA
jgi:hypothetical protein